MIRSFGGAHSAGEPDTRELLREPPARRPFFQPGPCSAHIAQKPRYSVSRGSGNWHTAAKAVLLAFRGAGPPSSGGATSYQDHPIIHVRKSCRYTPGSLSVPG